MLIEGGEAGTHRPGVVGRLRIERPDVLLIKAAGEPSEEVDMEDSQDAGKEMVIAEGSEPQVDVIPRRKDTRPAGVPGWSFKARNSFMFSPDADEWPYHPPVSIASSSTSITPLKFTSHGATRLPSSPSDSPALAVPPSPMRSRIDAAIAGNPYIPAPSKDTVAGFSNVPLLPTPSTAAFAPALMTQGLFSQCRGYFPTVAGLPCMNLLHPGEYNPLQREKRWAYGSVPRHREAYGRRQRYSLGSHEWPGVLPLQ